MTCYERMRLQMKSTGLYQMNESSLAAAEMKAYADVLELLNQELENILVDCFIDEIESPMGEYFENLFGFPITQYPLTDEKRQEREYKIQLMKIRLKIKNNDFNKNSILEQLKTWGFTASLEEDFVNRKITVTVLEDLGYCETNDDKITCIQQILPCHSTVEINLLENN